MTALTFTEWLFGNEHQRPADDVVTKFANSFKGDREWPTYINSYEHLQSYMRARYLNLAIIQIKDVQAADTLSMPVEEVAKEIKQAADRFLNNYNSMRFITRIAWDDYNKYLEGAK